MAVEPRFLSRLLAAERRRRATPAGSRRLTCREQAVLALRWFRDRTRVEALGRDHGVSRATAYRYPPWQHSSRPSASSSTHPAARQPPDRFRLCRTPAMVRSMAGQPDILNEAAATVA